MGTLSAALFTTVDGVVQSPHEFHLPCFDDRMGELMAAFTDRCGARVAEIRSGTDGVVGISGSATTVHWGRVCCTWSTSRPRHEPLVGHAGPVADDPGSDLRVSRSLVVPAAELTERFSRSSGPGGQGVNTADSRVELSWDVAASAVLAAATRERLLAGLATRLAGGVLTVAASEHRAQLANRRAARERMAALLLEAAAPPPPRRRATRPSRSARRRRVEAERRRRDVKRGRRGHWGS